MADSTVVDVSKMKVIDLRKELKSRGLVSTGDKADLVARLQAAMAQDESQDDHGDINLSSDEIDSDGVLDEDDKSHNDILEDAIDTLNEDLALDEQITPPPVPETKPKAAETVPHRTLKRKITSDIKENVTEKAEQKETKKIVLNRAASVTSTTPKEDPEEKTDPKPEAPVALPLDSSKVKITADLDAKTKMEMRAKRFGLPVKVTDADRKEARKQRFGQGASSAPNTGSISTTGTPSLSENLDKLKQRAERFGQSVSKIMSDIENKERLEKRKAKFGTSK